jgi:hypothetical protein
LLPNPAFFSRIDHGEHDEEEPMRCLTLALGVLALAAYAAPAAAVEAPARHRAHEPPDPCASVHGSRAHAHCVAQHKGAHTAPDDWLHGASGGGHPRHKTAPDDWLNH